MAGQRYYFESMCLLVDKATSLSKPERSLWHFDQFSSSGLIVKLRKLDGNSNEPYDENRPFLLPQRLPHQQLTLVSAVPFHPLTLQMASAPEVDVPVRMEMSPKTKVSFAFREYRVVLSIGLAESLFVVSPTSARIAFDLVPKKIETLLAQLVAPIYFNGHIQFTPVIHLTIVATTPSTRFICLTQGRLVNNKTHKSVAAYVRAQLYALVQRDSFSSKVRVGDLYQTCNWRIDLVTCSFSRCYTGRRRGWERTTMAGEFCEPGV